VSFDGLVVRMGHDLRSPLTSIIGFSDLLLLELPGTLNETQRQQLAEIRSAGGTMLRLIDHVIELARLQAGVVKVQAETTLLEPFLDELRSTFTARAEERGLRLDVDLSGPDRWHTDPKVLGRILGHLIANGLAFTESGGVTVRVHEGTEPGGLAIAVVDTGVGISEHDRTMLFQPFDRAASAGGPLRTGIGLGLYLSRRFADLLGAGISVESEVGRGTTCTVLLPEGPSS
jgi:two-component system CheB/CheR fusion protein